MDVPSSSGFLCHLCQWRSRSESKELMDQQTLMAHGQRHHYLQSSQLEDYVRDAKCVQRDPSRNRAFQLNYPPRSPTTASNFKSPNMWQEMAATLPRSLPKPTGDPQSLELWQRMVEFQYYGHHIQNVTDMTVLDLNEPELSGEQFKSDKGRSLGDFFPTSQHDFLELEELPAIPNPGWMLDGISMADFDYELSQDPAFCPQEPQQDIQEQVQSTSHSPAQLLSPMQRFGEISEEYHPTDYFTNMLMDGTDWMAIDYSSTSSLEGAEAGEAGELMDIYDAGQESGLWMIGTL